MDIEPKLREMLVLKDPGARFTDAVLARVGDVPSGPARDGVVQIADARSRARGRRLLLGVLVVAAAAAATLPFLPDLTSGTSQSVTSQLQRDGTIEADPATPAPTSASGVQADGQMPLDCIDPDMLQTLLVPGSTGQFRVDFAIPPELADFKPTAQLAWLGATERRTGAIVNSAAVYRTALAPAVARAAAAEGLIASGWQARPNNSSRAVSVFVSADSVPPGETYCRGSEQVGLIASALDGATYVVLGKTRMEGARTVTASCTQPAQPVARVGSGLEDFVPVLELPHDRGTGQPAAIGGYSGSGSVSGTIVRATVTFRLEDTPGAVARHLAGQLAAQGWSIDADWTSEGSAGSTWTRRVGDGQVLQGMLAVAAFDDHRFTATLRVLRTK